MPAFQGVWPTQLASFAIDNAGVLSATGDKIACIGQFWHPDVASGKEISRVGFRFATVTKAGGSGLTVSLQDVDLTNTTAPFRPDEVQDQTVAIANGNASFASNTWIRTGTLSANRSVTNGQWLAVVIEFDGSGRLGSDSVNLAALRLTVQYNNQGFVRKSAGSWSSNSSYPAIALECSDGTFGFLSPGVWAGASATQLTYGSTSTPDERGNAFTPTVTMVIDGVSIMGGPNNLTADFDLVIYENGTAIHTTSIDASATRLSGSFPQFFGLTSRVTLTANTQYYITVRPSTTNTVSMYEIAMNSASLVAATGFGSGAGIISRTDAGSWSSVTTTSLFPMQLRVCDVSGSSGGGLILPRAQNGGYSA